MEKQSKMEEQLRCDSFVEIVTHLYTIPLELPDICYTFFQYSVLMSFPKTLKLKSVFFTETITENRRQEKGPVISLARALLQD